MSVRLHPRTDPLRISREHLASLRGVTNAFVAAALLAPVVVILHELGHYLAFGAFGFPGVRFRAFSVTYANADTFWRLIAQGRAFEAALVYAPWQVALATAAGPAVTYIIIGVSAFLSMRPGATVAVRALGFVACCRSAALVPSFLLSLTGAPLFVVLRSDEAKLGALTHISPILLVAASVFAGPVLAWLLVLTSSTRWRTTIALVSGWVAGTWLLSYATP